MTAPSGPTGPSRAARHVVARTDELPPGERVIVELDGRQVGVFNVDGEYIAFLHRCPHMAGPLCSGEIIGLIESDGPGDVRLDPDRKFLTCPLHGWEFDIHTGQSYFDPTRMRARRYPVEVRPGAEVGAEPVAGRVPGPYTAETFEVSVERDYVVVSTARMPGAEPSTPSPGPSTERTR
jgi:3-phenylpropionate/trans-cinnamate dioxygenase ferredoxin subunit